MESQTWFLGAGTAVINIDDYGGLGQGVITVKYKTGNTAIACEADIWNAYDGVSFVSQGYVKVQMS